MNKEKKSVLLVDLADNPIKQIEKLKAHKRPILHRAFSVFLYNENKILIQRRAKTKYHSPSLWANACCSHPITNDIISEANVRLKEELGIKEKVELKPLFSFVYYAKLENVYEYELDHVLVGNYCGKIKLNKTEADKFKWVEVRTLEKLLVSKPNVFAPWFLICAPRVIKHLKKPQSLDCD